MKEKIQFYLSFIFCFIAFSALSTPDDGYRIEIKINNFNKDTIYLGYHLGSKQYIQDTIPIDSKKNIFIAEGEEMLPGGIYLIILPPDNRYFEIFIGGENDQHFSLETDVEDLNGNANFKGSEENIRFFEYLKYIGDNKKELEQITAKEKAETDPVEIKKLQKAMDELNNGVTQYQLDMIKKYPGSLLEAVIKLTMPPDIPNPTTPMTDEEEANWRYQYFKSHYFDALNFADDRLLRTPLLENKIEYYVSKLTVGIPDSIAVSVDYILEKAAANEEVFRFCLMHFLNKYATSKIVGMDAMYVHLVDNYYAKDKAPWVTEEVLANMTKRARELRPLLIGKKAPDIKIKTFDKSPVSLWAFESSFTILYFWDPKCGHCNKVAPDMVKFANDYKDKGVRVFSVCTKDREIEACAEAVIEKGFTDWTNTIAIENTDLYYRLNYAIKSTPVIYILDENKVILSKNIGASQLPEVMDMMIMRKAESGN
ncbi:MAG: DUF5106 domain-containing protein [Bacteroidota bacterium]